jgi:hypothetical protein
MSTTLGVEEYTAWWRAVEPSRQQTRDNKRAMLNLHRKISALK